MDCILSKIKKLAFFELQELNIEPVQAGLSHTSFVVETKLTKQKVFVKYFNHSESLTSFFNEIHKNKSLENILPKVLFSSDEFLITEYINDAIDLSRIDGKFAYFPSLFTQLAKLHTNPVLPKSTTLNLDLAFEELIESLCINNSLSTMLESIVDQILLSLSKQMNRNIRKVCCHGDLNYSNILIDRSKQLWIVDWESSAIAPAEYDIAMFIAVNQITDQFDSILNTYHQYSPIKLDESLVSNYIAVCLLLNALWYLSKSKMQKSFLTLANQQFELFDKHTRFEHELTLKMRQNV